MNGTRGTTYRAEDCGKVCADCGREIAEREWATYTFPACTIHCDRCAGPTRGPEAAEGVCPLCGGHLIPEGEFGRCLECGCTAKANSSRYEYQRSSVLAGGGGVLIEFGFGGTG